MLITQIKNIIIDRFKRRGNRMRPIYLQGEKGIGKTEIVLEAAKELGLPCVTVCLSAMEAADFSGLPRINPETGQTSYARPAWLPEGPCVIFFDEANRASTDTQQPLLTITQDRHINGHSLHPDTLLVFAGNPPGGVYQVQELDPAMAERVVIVNAEPDFATLTQILDKKYPDCQLERTWLLQQGNISPRTAEFTLRAISGLEKESALYLTLLQAEIGAEGASSLISWMKKQVVLSYQSVVDGMEKPAKKGGVPSRLKPDVAKLVADTWNKSPEAVSTFTTIFKMAVDKIEAQGGDLKKAHPYMMQMLAVVLAANNESCCGIALDALDAIQDKTYMLNIIRDGILANEAYEALLRTTLKDDLANVEIQDAA